MQKYLLTVILITLSIAVQSQENLEKDLKKLQPFVAYELGEAVFNKFNSFSGELGVKFSNNQLLRLVHMNVKLTEEHLSSSFAGAVKGQNVEGSFFGFEVFYDIPIAWKTLYIAPSVGYYNNSYSHIVLDEKIENKTATIGLGLSYRETDLFGLKGLYYTFTIPLRLSINPIEEINLGDAIIANSTFDNNIWLFIGYQF